MEVQKLGMQGYSSPPARKELSLRRMDELSPHCPTGAVSFCQKFNPVDWSSLSEFLETGEALDDYAKFCSSLMETYTSLTMSIASDNEVRMGRHCRSEVERLESYYAANARSSSLMKHDADIAELLAEGSTFSLVNDPVRIKEFEYGHHLKALNLRHQYFAYRRALAKLDIIKWDSDFDEVFQRLKSEKQWTDHSDGILGHGLALHFSLLRKLNDDLGIASVSKMPESDKLLEAINNEHSQEISQSDKLLEAINNEHSQGISDLIKHFEKGWKRNYFFPGHMEAKILQRKLFDQAESSGTVMLPKECHFTSPKLSPLIDRALVHKSQALEKFLKLKGRWGRSFGGFRSKLLPAAVVFAGIPAAYIGGTGMRKG